MHQQGAQVGEERVCLPQDGRAGLLVVGLKLEAPRKKPDVFKLKEVHPAFPNESKALSLGVDEVVVEPSARDDAVDLFLIGKEVARLQRVRGIERMVGVGAVLPLPDVDEVGRGGQRDAEGGAGVVVARQAAPGFGVDVVDGPRQRGPLVERVVHVQPRRAALVAGALDDALVVLPGARHVKAGVLGAAADRDIRGRKQPFLPKKLLLVVDEAASALGLLKLLQATLAEGCLRGLGRKLAHAQLLANGRKTERLGEINPGRSRFSAFCRDDDHAVGGARPVNGRRRRAFENLDGLNVLRIDVSNPVDGVVLVGPVAARSRLRDGIHVGGHRDVAHDDAVHDVEGLGVSVDRRDAPEPHVHAPARRSGIRVDLRPRHLSVECPVERGDLGGAGQVGRVDRRDGVGQILPFHAGGKARNHNLIHAHDVPAQFDIEHRLPRLQFHFLLLVAHKGEHERSATLRHIQLVAALHVRRRSDRGVLDPDVGPRNRLPVVRVCHHSLNRILALDRTRRESPSEEKDSDQTYSQIASIIHETDSLTWKSVGSSRKTLHKGDTIRTVLLRNCQGLVGGNGRII
jgi:hypothetical protein